MKASPLVLFTAFAVALAAACSDGAPSGPERSKGLFGDQKPGAPGDTSGGTPGTPVPPPPGPDTGTAPQPWPRTVLGQVQGVTYTPGGPDSVQFEAIAGATVRLFKAVSDETQPPVLVATTTTSQNGEFQFPNLTEGRYRVDVAAPAGSGYKDASVWFVPQDVVWRMGISLYRQ